MDNSANSKKGRIRSKRTFFSQVSNIPLRDDALSLKAKGLYALIQSYITIEGFVLYKSTLQKQCKEGKHSFQSAWDELKKHGYLIQYRMRDKDNTFYYEYELLDSPVETEQSIPHTKNPYLDFPHTKNPYPGNQYAENPDTENPGSGKSGYINNTDVNNTDVNNTEKQQHNTNKVVVSQRLLDEYVRAFNTYPSQMVKETIRTQLFVFKEGQENIVSQAIEIAGSKGKGWDYSLGILARWRDLELYTWDKVFDYLYNGIV